MDMDVLRLQKQIEDTENKMIEILLPECRRLFWKETTNLQDKNETEQEIKAFMELRKKLPERVRARTGYEIAAYGGSDGMSGFHFGFEPKFFLPFQDDRMVCVHGLLWGLVTSLPWHCVSD